MNDDLKIVHAMYSIQQELELLRQSQPEMPYETLREIAGHLHDINDTLLDILNEMGSKP